MKKCKPKSICSGRKKIKKEWLGRKVFDSKTGQTEWKMKRHQETKDYREKPLAGKHLHTPRREWQKGFKRLAHNLATKNRQLRKDEGKEKNRIKKMR